MHTVEEELQKRFRNAIAKKNYDENDIDAAREYIQAMLNFVLYSHRLYAYLKCAGENEAEGAQGHKN